MPDPVILTADPVRKKIVTLHDQLDDSFAVETRTDVEPILDENQRVRSHQPDGWKGREHLVASIPMPIWQAMKDAWRKLGLSKEEQQESLKHFLNDPDNAKFRTKHGRL